MKYFAVIMIVAQVAFLAWMLPKMIRSHRKSKVVFAEIHQNMTSMNMTAAVLKRNADPTPMSAVEAEALLSVLQHGTRIIDVSKLEIPKTDLPMLQFREFKLPGAPKNTLH